MPCFHFWFGDFFPHGILFGESSLLFPVGDSPLMRGGLANKPMTNGLRCMDSLWWGCRVQSDEHKTNTKSNL